MAQHPPTKACIFDMDGLLINSERIYTDVTNELLARYNKPPLPIDIKMQMMGVPGFEATKILLKWSGIDISAEELYSEAGRLQKTKFPGVKEMPGTRKLIDYLIERNIPIALATSSSINNFHLKTAHLSHIFSHFEGKIVRGDDPRIPKGRGKPAPDIYLVSLDIINKERESKNLEPLTPQECLVFGKYQFQRKTHIHNLSLEDSIAGVQAGKSAGMRVVWVPDPLVLEYSKEKKKDIISSIDEILFSLEDFDPKKYGL
ncbi:hypothetical protein PORY_001143 [Pneumocystis oryctolagi]|uniref:Uncharacterized protein n=1 Tax=Pneumocystis oryctolagi TaxID=42067 RepID=A0ACB7CET2_9ASCO|nr:hypothetical protein PORY_001143 [Pneumocystis oryctolagi]